MDTLELTRKLESSPPSEAIGQIVQVFRDGCREAEVLRRTSERLSSSEIETQLAAIEVRMLHEISSICGEYLMEMPLLARN